MDEQKTPAPPADDMDIKVSKGTGVKIVVMLLILASIGGGVTSYYFFLLKPEQERQANLQVHKDFWNEFTEYHATGYGGTWKCIFGGTAESQVNTNLKLETVIETAISQNEGLFGKLILACLDNDEALLEAVGKEPPPSLVGTLAHAENLRGMKVPKGYEEQFEGLPETVEEVDASWRVMAEYFHDANERAKWDSKLTDAANKGWGMLWAKARKREKFNSSDLAQAWRYYKFMSCSLGSDYVELGEFKKISELESLISKISIDGACSTDEKAAAHFPTVDGCAKKFLLSGQANLQDEQFQNAIKNSYYDEQRSLAAIAGSFEGDEGIIYKGCITRARTYTKATGITNLFKALMAYSKARIGLLKKYQESKKPYEKK
ncbi:MAG: hypothetical protein JRG91_01000 [Deltaproteobacteria bacterium]|nr:hypothetical protein [Deltaproteobacteria bacterium]